MLKKRLIRRVKRIPDDLNQIRRRFKTKLPRKIPRKLFSEFTMDGKVRILYSFRDDSYPDSKPRIFEKEKIESMISQSKNGINKSYGKTSGYLRDAMEKYSKEIKNKEGVDVGSVSGWFSAMTLAARAKNSYILEYNKIDSKHPRVIPIQNKDFIKNPRKFDFGTSISSIEHDGLGRYGDPINPWGDLKAMKDLKKIVRKRRLLFLSIPIGKDTLVWNKHRIYGRLRFPKLVEGWEIIDSFGFKESDLDFDAGKRIYRKATPHQPVFVLKNI
ncbi:MAG: DUF268 domain-containing protein [Candidatus Pacearchaeota archaeon]